MHAKVSIIIPCFNYGRFLNDAVASALNQTHPAVEVIVIDDASPDTHTQKVLDQLDHQRILLIRNKETKGVSISRNIAISSASGAYIVPLDADDKLAPSFVEKTIPILENLHAEVVYADTTLFGDQEGVFNLPPFSPELMYHGNVVVNTAMFRKTNWAEAGGYSPNLTHGFEDWDFWLSLLEKGARFEKINEPLFYYRKHGPSRSDLAEKYKVETAKIIKQRHPLLNIHTPVEEETGLRKFRWFRSLSRRIEKILTKPYRKPSPPTHRPIRLHYFDPPDLKNFGDQLNIPLLQTLTGRPVLYANPSEATHVCIGSMLEALNPALNRSRRAATAPVNIWGAGFIAPLGEHPNLRGTNCDSFLRPIRAYAVRGKLTLERLKESGIDTSQTVLGDPGLLVGRIFDFPRVKKEFAMGIIPHYVDQDNSQFDMLKRFFKRSIFINILDPVSSVISLMQKCEAIVSSSLHGLILADSFGIPNLHVVASDNLTGGIYKFKDYCSAIGLSHFSLTIEDLIQKLQSDPDFVHTRPLPQSTLISSVQNGLIEALYRAAGV